MLKAQDGSTATDGDRVTLRVARGDDERVLKGRLRTFRPNDDQIAELKDRIKALEEDNDPRWEVDTKDGVIGVAPETVLALSD